MRLILNIRRRRIVAMVIATESLQSYPSLCSMADGGIMVDIMGDIMATIIDDR